jgi:hypothetical protein
MWLLSFIPDAWIALAVHIIFGLGVAGLILTWLIQNVFDHFTGLVPWIKTIRWVSIVLFVSGLYFEGGIGVESEWRSRVAQLEAKIKVAEQQSKDANDKLKNQVVSKVKIIKINSASNKESITQNKEVIDAECSLNDKAIVIYNNAVKNGAK